LFRPKKYTRRVYTYRFSACIFDDGFSCAPLCGRRATVAAAAAARRENVSYLWYATHSRGRRRSRRARYLLSERVSKGRGAVAEKKYSPIIADIYDGPYI